MWPDFEDCSGCIVEVLEKFKIANEEPVNKWDVLRF